MPRARRWAAELEEFRSAKQELSAAYLSGRADQIPLKAASYAPRANVVGVGIGERIVAGKPTGIRAIKILVVRKVSAREIAPRHMLPRRIRGLPVDVEEVGRLQAFTAPAMRRRRPARGSNSVR